MHLCKASKRDNTANIRFNSKDRKTLGLKPGALYKVEILHSDGVVVWAAGRATLAMDKMYLTGLGLYPRYDYVSPELGDSRPARVVTIERI